MAKYIERHAAATVEETTGPEKVPVNDDEQEFDEYLYEHLWDADLDLQLAEDNEDEAHYHFGYITALREVATKFFGYADDTLDKLTPTYVSFDERTTE